MIARLPDLYRDAFVLRDLEEMSTADVARASYCDTPRILRQATAAALPADIEASLKAFLRARTTAFRSR